MHRCVFRHPKTSTNKWNIVAPVFKVAVLAAFLFLTPSPARAQGLLGGLGGLLGQLLQQLQQLLTAQQGLTSVIIPASSVVRPADLGVRGHTNVRYMTFVNAGVTPSAKPPYGGYFFETPQSLACIYHAATPISGCNPNKTNNTPTGGSYAIAIVDAYDDPTAASDLEAFDAQFLIPSGAGLEVVYASGSKPPLDPSGGWEIEEALDVQYAHAMAPNAKIYLVEAASSNNSDLFSAVQVASNLISCGQTTSCPSGSSGKGEVSMSWGGAEFSGETSYDPLFTTPNVVYFAASGDVPGTSYPCVSAHVVCIGGTTTARQYTSGNFIQEISWPESGGGVSGYEPSPPYQSGMGEDIQYTMAGNSPPSGSSGQFPNRAIPDLALDSNPDTGVWVYAPAPGQGYSAWFILGGTSVATPLMAAITNQAGHFPASSDAALQYFYGTQPSGAFYDVHYGACGLYSGFRAGSGWDPCTGLGAPRTFSGH